MNEEEAKEICMNFIEENKDRPIILHKAIKSLVNSLKKKDKIIELAVKNNVGACLNVYCKNRDNQGKCIKCIIENFERKVENEN